VQAGLESRRFQEDRTMMKASLRQVGNVAVVDLSGKITIGEGDVVLRDKVHELLDAGKSQILLNLEKISYMDSAGIGELVACYKRAREKGGTVRLLKPSGKVADLLQLTKLQEVFDTFEDEPKALKSF
jgi:anti-sigma B factor antagonist